MDFFSVVTVEEARQKIASVWQVPHGIERVPLTEAFDRFLAEDLVAGEDVPGFDRSTVDGFAVRSADTFGASETLPSYLTVMGQVAAGEPAIDALAEGVALQIATGAMLPPGADAVVMVEHTDWLDGQTIGIHRPVAPGENVVRRGEDVARGTLVLTAGRRLRPADLGVLAALGQPEVAVRKPLRVAVISTGSELVTPGESPLPGQVRDINTYMLQALIRQAGGQVTACELVGDDHVVLQRAITNKAAEADIVLISGGSSVGARDYTLKVLNELGSPGLLFHGLALRPGKPTAAAVADGRIYFALPGHPVSAAVVCKLLVLPLVEMGGYTGEPSPVRVRARLTRSIPSGAGREEHVRVRLVDEEGETWAIPVLGKSGLVSTLVQADGEVVIPLNLEGLPAGAVVDVELYGD